MKYTTSHPAHFAPTNVGFFDPSHTFTINLSPLAYPGFLSLVSCGYCSLSHFWGERFLFLESKVWFNKYCMYFISCDHILAECEELYVAASGFLKILILEPYI